MIENYKEEWRKIEKEIYAAFEGVKLENGIGYFEAGAIDNYLNPTHLKYQQEKAQDEREDWRNQLIEFRNSKTDISRHCFMDAKGLRFYLPFLMINKDPALNNILHFYISEAYQREGYLPSKFTESVALLTKEQKRSIFHFYDFLSKIEKSNFWEEYLNAEFNTGENKMKDFKFKEFMRKHFNVR